MTKVNLNPYKAPTITTPQNKGNIMRSREYDQLEVAYKFGLSGKMDFTYITGGAGIESIDIPVLRAGNKKYLIKRLKVEAERDALYCMDYMRFLAKNGIPIPCVNIRGTTRNNPEDFFVELDGEYYGMDRWVDGINISTSKASPAVFENVGNMLARIHNLSQRFKTPHSRSSEHYTLLMALETVKKMPLSNFAPDDREYVLALITSLESINLENMPMCHMPSDLNFGNIKFNEDGQPIAIFDWDNSRYAYRIEDILATVTQTGRQGEGYNLHSKLIATAIKPFIKGYNKIALKSNYSQFSREELQLLPFLYRVNFLYRLLLSRDIACIGTLKLIGEIFSGREWNNFLDNYRI